MKKTANIVIIGAGISGSSAAFHLAKMGAKNIVILEAFTSGGLYTSASAAMLMHQTGVKETTELAKFSIQKYLNFEKEIGEKVHFNKTGSVLFSTTDQGFKKLQEYISIQTKLGIPTEKWSGSQIEHATDNLISGNGVMFASYCPLDGYIDARKVVQAYLSQAIKLGAKLYENSRVVAIAQKNGKIAGVETENGRKLETEIVLDCAGGFSKDIGRMVRVYIPIKNNKRNLAILKPSSKIEKNFTIVEDFDEGWYFRPFQDNVLVGVCPTEYIDDERREFHPSFDKDRLPEIKKYVAIRAPKLFPVHLVGGGAGYRPMLDPDYSDGLPILGLVPKVKGYYTSSAWGEFGITLGPIGGELIAQIILNKQTTVDTKPFLLSRFDNKISASL